jgi:hypothetical protein
MTKKRRRTYEPRVFDGRIIMSDEIERIRTAARVAISGFASASRIAALTGLPALARSSESAIPGSKATSVEASQIAFR